MSEPLLPERLEELIAGYVLGNLSPEEAEEFTRLLAENPELNIEVNRLQEVLELMPYALPQAAPPPSLRSSILEAAETSSLPDLTPKRLKRRSLPWRKIAGSMAALLAIALSVDNYFLRQQLSVTQAQSFRQKEVIAMLQNPNTHLISLKGRDMASSASGSIVMTSGKQKAVLALRNLPVLPKGQSYHLWSVVNDEMTSWGQFNANKKGTVLVDLPVRSSSEIASLVVTVEMSPAPVRPAGRMVMASNF